MPPIQTARMIHRDNRADFDALRMEMHAARKQVFVDQLKWDLATTDGLYEIDEYDHENTLYLIVADTLSGGHLGSVRLLPTDGPHLLGDKFACLCADGVPRGADIYEITRLVTRPGLSRDEARQVRQMLAVAILEFALAHQVRHFTMMTHMVFLSSVIAFGWDCEPLGMPQEMDGVAVAALRIDVDAAMLARLRQQTNLVDPVLAIDLTESALAE
ncbi:MAG: autoinducer synthase [Sandarakinorhabdus sp.]|nr:autoinducer synthase [Sandarakinorhabdus sp.]